VEEEVKDQIQACVPLETAVTRYRYDLRTVRKCSALCRGTGLPCRQPAMKNGKCKMHGGKSGAPKGNKKALKHGRYSQKALEEKTLIREIIKKSREFMKGLQG